MANTKKAAAKKTKSTQKTPARPKAATGRKKSKSAGEQTVTVDRRTSVDRRSASDRRKKSEPVAVERRTIQRRAKVSRRRQIDPTTCERDYSGAEVEFMNALEEYKRTSGRMFPTCSEILEVIMKLGYEKRPEPSVEPQAEESLDPAPVDLPQPVEDASLEAALVHQSLIL